MPVVEKIANIQGFHNIQCDLKDLKITAKFDDMLKSCISFTNWYDKNRINQTVK